VFGLGDSGVAEERRVVRFFPNSVVYGCALGISDLVSEKTRPRIRRPRLSHRRSWLVLASHRRGWGLLAFHRRVDGQAFVQAKRSPGHGRR